MKSAQRFRVRNRIIVEMLANGLMRKEIAYRLGMCHLNTVSARIKRLKRRHRAKTSSHLVAIFFRRGLID